jgi:glyoxylase-like metal-dependent hydrolase (beta-lactamase superfamily II)
MCVHKRIKVAPGMMGGRAAGRAPWWCGGAGVEARVERIGTPRAGAESDGEAELLTDAGAGTQEGAALAPAGDAGPPAADAEYTAGESNCWLIGDDEEVIVIDPGTDAESVLDQVGEREILAVICTHGHPEHADAAVEVAERDEAPVALHRADRLLWRSAHLKGTDPEIDMQAGGRFEVSDVGLEVIHTAGHTAGSVSLYCRELGVVFTGDALCASGPVPHDGVYLDFPRQLTVIGERLLDLPYGTRVLSGHGPEFTIGEASKQFDSWVTAGPAGKLG